MHAGPFRKGRHLLGLTALMAVLGSAMLLADDLDNDGVDAAVEIADGTDPANAADFAAYSLGLAARYALDGNANDSSGQNMHGTLAGSPAATTGVLGQAIEFDGTNDSFSRYPAPTVTLPFTWAIWVKAPSGTTNTWLPVMQIGDSSRKSPGLEYNIIDNTHIQVGLYHWDGGYGGGSSAIQTCDSIANWHHLAITSEAGGIRRLYFDGQQVALINQPGFGQANTTLYLGGDIGLNSRKHYWADEVRLYNRVLAANEIQAMYDRQVLRPPLITSNLPALQEAATGQSLALSVAATGNPAVFSYQWYFNNTPIAAAEGGESAVLNVLVSNTTAGNYRVRITNSTGAADSATCLVAPSEDGDSDGLSDWREVNIYNTNSADTDTDDDGLTDGAEVNQHASNPTSQDSDQDGFNDGYEVSVDSNPADQASTPGMQPHIMTAMEMHFPAATGKTYRVESSVDLNNWQELESGISGNGSEISRFYTIQGNNRRFLRVVEESAPE